MGFSVTNTGSGVALRLGIDTSDIAKDVKAGCRLAADEARKQLVALNVQVDESAVDRKLREVVTKARNRLERETINLEVRAKLAGDGIDPRRVFNSGADRRSLKQEARIAADEKAEHFRRASRVVLGSTEPGSLDDVSDPPVAEVAKKGGKGASAVMLGALAGLASAASRAADYFATVTTINRRLELETVRVGRMASAMRAHGMGTEAGAAERGMVAADSAGAMRRYQAAISSTGPFGQLAEMITGYGGVLEADADEQARIAADRQSEVENRSQIRIRAAARGGRASMFAQKQKEERRMLRHRLINGRGSMKPENTLEFMELLSAQETESAIEGENFGAAIGGVNAGTAASRMRATGIRAARTGNARQAFEMELKAELATLTASLVADVAGKRGVERSVSAGRAMASIAEFEESSQLRRLQFSASMPNAQAMSADQAYGIASYSRVATGGDQMRATNEAMANDIKEILSLFRGLRAQ